jgi:hypothetical protein
MWWDGERSEETGIEAAACRRGAIERGTAEAARLGGLAGGRGRLGAEVRGHGSTAAKLSRNTAVCKSTSAAMVAGLISAMLWKGVIRTPRLSAARCM